MPEPNDSRELVFKTVFDDVLNHIADRAEMHKRSAEAFNREGEIQNAATELEIFKSLAGIAYYADSRVRRAVHEHFERLYGAGEGPPD